MLDQNIWVISLSTEEHKGHPIYKKRVYFLRSSGNTYSVGTAPARPPPPHVCGEKNDGFGQSIFPYFFLFKHERQQKTG